MVRRTIIASFVFILASTAAAQTPPDPADALFRQGNALYKEQKWSEAREAYESAWRLKKAHDIAANLAYAEMKLGRYRDAAEHLAFAVKSWPPTGKSDKREYAIERFQLAKKEIGTLRIDVSVPRAEVLIDGKPIGQAPLDGEVFVEPGAHVIEATLKGYKPVRAPFDAPKGSAQDLALTFEALPDPPPSIPPSPKRSPIPGAVLGAVGGAAAIAGVGLLVGSRAKVSRASELHDAVAGAGHTCTTGAPSYDTRCEELASTSKKANTFRDAGAGVLIGAGVAAVGAVTYFLWPQKGATEAPAPSLRMAPAASATGGGVVFLGTF